MPHAIRSRLAAMMFLQYFAMGAVLPILSLYLKDYLGFSPERIGYILAMPAIAAFTAPFVAAHVADRLISSERLMGLYHLGAAGVMILLAFQQDWMLFLLVYLFHSMLFMPTSALSNAVALHHVPNAKRDFGGVRMWGTIGWVAVAWSFGYFWLRGGGAETAAGRLPHALFVSALTGAILGLFLFTFPAGAARDSEGRPGLAVRKAIVALSHPSLILFCAMALLAAITNTFYMQWMSPFLSQMGFSEEYILPVLSLGQLSEIAAMALLGRVLTAVGYKGAMMLGIGAQVLRFAVFAFLPFQAAIVAAIPLHGISWTFFFTAGYVFVDHHSPKRDRAAVQQFYHMLMTGVGSLTGSILAGQVAAWFTQSDGLIAFKYFWAVPVAIAGAAMLVLGFFFKEE